MDLGILKGLKGSKVTADSLYEVFSKAIEDKILAPGDKLPSSRDLATYLGISRTTVMKTLEKLISRGYLTSSQGAGTWVSFESASNGKEKPLDQSPKYPWSDRFNNFAGTLSLQASEPIVSTAFDEINFGSSPMDLVPVSAWRKSLVRLSQSITDTAFDTNEEVFGYRPLREAIAAFLRRTKGIICDAEQIVLASGVQTVVSPMFTLLVKPGDLAVCENPGFWGAREQFQGMGADVVTVPVDEQGLVVDALNSLERAPQWLYIAPSCQEPTGVTLSAERRRQLLRWCTKEGTAILEDDWDSEFHYGGPSAPSLFSLDESGSVIYFYSFWRLLYPLVSVGCLVIPKQLVEVFESYKNIWDRQFTMLEHRVLTELLNDGHIESHIRSMWKKYRKQRQQLIHSLSKGLLPDISLVHSSTGMHVLVRFDKRFPSSLIQKSAADAGLTCAATTPYYVHSPRENEYMFRFSNIPTDEIEARVETFAKLLRAE